MAPDLVVVCVLLLCLLAWALLELWVAERRIRSLEEDLDVALGWEEQRRQRDAVVRPTLYLCDRETEA